MPTRSASRQSDQSFNLTKATEVGRLVVKGAVIALVVLMVGRFALNGAIAIWKRLNPEPPPPPTQGFGALPDINFGESQAVAIPKTYQLELPGQLPYFSDRAVVYLQPEQQLGLLSLEQTKAIAARLGFLSEPLALDEVTYRWRRSSTLNATLEMNTVTHNFSFSTDYLARPELQINNDLPSTFDAVQTVKQFLSAADLLPPDVATAAGETRFLKITGGALKEAVSLSDAQVIQVDLFRTPLNNVPTVTSDGETGIISGLVTLVGNKPTVIELTRRYDPIEYELTHTYPLRSSQEAWQILQGGGGFIASARRGDIAVIRSVGLAYFETADQPYLQPVYVFSGDEGFKAYVSALAASVKTAVPAPILPTPTPESRPGFGGV